MQMAPILELFEQWRIVSRQARAAATLKMKCMLGKGTGELSVMNYCGVEYIAFESIAGGSWKWRILLQNKTRIKIGGHAADRAAAVEHAHEAIGEALRANASADHEEHIPQLADDVLHILHGARGLAPAKAVEALQPFLSAMRHRVPEADRFADASADAVNELVKSLQTKGVATDDTWQAAIESTVSFANEAC
jgi:hypothetical protein